MEGKQNSRVWINGPASQETTAAKLLLLYNHGHCMKQRSLVYTHIHTVVTHPYCCGIMATIYFSFRQLNDPDLEHNTVAIGQHLSLKAQSAHIASNFV